MLQPASRCEGQLQLHPCLYLQAVTPFETVDRWIISQSLHFYDRMISILLALKCFGFFYNQEGICSIEKVPFRGALCSDAAGTQKTYKWIMKQVNTSLSGRLWDNSQQAPYFNYKVCFTSFIHHQIVAVRVEIWWNEHESFFVCLFPLAASKWTDSSGLVWWSTEYLS